MPLTAPTISDAKRMLSAGMTLVDAIDSRLVVHAGIEVHVVQQKFLERRALHVLRDAAIAAPVIRHRAAAVRE